MRFRRSHDAAPVGCCIAGLGRLPPLAHDRALSNATARSVPGFSSSAGGQQFLGGHTLTSTSGRPYIPLEFTNLPGDTANKRFLVGTVGFAALGVVLGFTCPTGSSSRAGEPSRSPKALITGSTPRCRRRPCRSTTSARSASTRPQFRGANGLHRRPAGGDRRAHRASTSTQGQSVTFTGDRHRQQPHGHGAVQGQRSEPRAPPVRSQARGHALGHAHQRQPPDLATYSGDSADRGADSNTLTHTVASRRRGGGSERQDARIARNAVSPGVTLFGGFGSRAPRQCFILVRGNSSRHARRHPELPRFAAGAPLQRRGPGHAHRRRRLVSPAAAAPRMRRRGGDLLHQRAATTAPRARWMHRANTPRRGLHVYGDAQHDGLHQLAVLGRDPVRGYAGQR